MPEAPQPVPQPEVTTGTQPHNWKKVGLTVLIILVVSGLIVTAYWFLVLNKSSDNSDLTGPVPKTNISTSTPSATTSAGKDETVDWKTHTGETIPVSFKIPQDFSIKEQKGIIQNTLYEGLIKVSDEKKEERFSVVNSATGATVAFLYKEDIIVDGIKGAKNYYTDYKDPSNTNLGPVNQTPKYVFTSFIGKNFAIHYDYNEDNEALMNKIIPTFKFLD